MDAAKNLKQTVAYKTGFYLWVGLLWTTLGCFAYSLALFSAQCIYWLYAGQWQELHVSLLFVGREHINGGPSMLVLRPLANLDWQWITAPNAWLGVHKAMVWLLQSSLASALFALGTALLLALSWLGNLNLWSPNRTIRPEGGLTRPTAAPRDS
jgi:hypothetical protein